MVPFMFRYLKIRTDTDYALQHTEIVVNYVLVKQLCHCQYYLLQQTKMHHLVVAAQSEA